MILILDIKESCSSRLCFTVEKGSSECGELNIFRMLKYDMLYWVKYLYFSKMSSHKVSIIKIIIFSTWTIRDLFSGLEVVDNSINADLIVE